MSLNKLYRPKTFEEIVGQDTAKMVLEQVSKIPEGKPRTYLLSGDFGTGKTSLAKVFAMALNCESKNKPCLKCPSCLSYGKDGRYLELDSAMMGNVKEVRLLRESLSYHVLSGYKVVVYDECQLLSGEAQGALLEITENPPENIFFLFLTTDRDKMKKTLISRSFELEFIVLNDQQMSEAILRVAKGEGILIPKHVEDIIIRRSAGHVRDAVSLVERFILLGEEKFIISVVVVDSLLKAFFIESGKGNKKEVQNIIERIAEVPVVVVKQDVAIFLKKILDSIYIKEEILFGYLTESLAQRIFQVYINFYPVFTKSTNDLCSFFNSLALLIDREKDKSFSKGNVSLDRFRCKDSL